MKSFFVILAFLIPSLTIYSQDWAPIGSTWYYSEGFSFWNEYDEDYIKFESVKDTIIDGKNCRKIVKHGKVACNDRPMIEYMYSENQKVFFFDPNFNDFQVLYDFNAEPLDKWSILVKDEPHRNTDTLNIIVDSTNTININEVNLKQLFVTYQFIYDYFNEGNIDTLHYNSRIIEKIGDIFYLFNYYPSWSFVCDANFSKGLRCYEDTLIGLYETGLADSCDYRHQFTDDINEFNQQKLLLKLYPNPTTRYVSILLENDDSNIERIQMYDLTGREFDICINERRIDLEEIPEGIYFIRFMLGNKQTVIRKVIKK